MKFVIHENQEGWGWGYFLCGYILVYRRAAV